MSQSLDEGLYVRTLRAEGFYSESAECIHPRLDFKISSKKPWISKNILEGGLIFLKFQKVFLESRV